jgi:hypothetical protein
MGSHLLTPQELMDMYDQVESRGGEEVESRGDRGEGGGGTDEDSRLLQRSDSDSSGADMGTSSSSSSSSGSGGGGGRKPLRRYIAITIVEIVFVLAESFFWQVSLGVRQAGRQASYKSVS